MARSLVGGHRLMLLEDNWGYLSDEIREIWLDQIIKNPAHTLVLVSNDRDILQRLDRIYHLENGRILRSGSYEALKDDLPC
jgi:ABC-type thiamine transport system ATPase subunit